MSHALEQINAARIGVICKSASTAPHFLLARVQLSICFPISRSRIHPTASPYLCLADCFQEMMFEQARTSHSNKLGFFGLISASPVAPDVLTGKFEATYLPPARAKVKTSSARNVMHLEQI